MKRILFIPLAALLVLAACERPTEAPAEDQVQIEWLSFGQEVHDEGLALAPADLAVNPTIYAGQDVRVEGTIVEVCQNRGCWLALENPVGNPVRVHVPKDAQGEYEWTLPMDLGPRRAIVEGIAQADTMSVEDLRHYAEDAGRPAEEVQAITTDEYVAYITARGILVERPVAPFGPDARPEAPDADLDVPVQEGYDAQAGDASGEQSGY